MSSIHVIEELMAGMQAARMDPLVKKIHRLLKGKPPAVQSGVIADLLALWLAGHLLFDDDGKIAEGDTASMREELLATHIALVRELLPINDKVVRAEFARRRGQ